MCLVTKQKRAKVLKEDMVVYKKLFISEEGKKLLPWYFGFRSFEYTLGKFHKETLGIHKNSESVDFYDQTASGAYHTISPLTEIAQGFHAAVTLDRLTPQKEYVIYSCTIPKDAKVFKDKTGLIVSDTIRIDSKIE